MGTFHGLEMSRQALAVQQSALYTTGHNIANANTPGFTRQRVNLEAMNGFPHASMNRPAMPGQVGTGVQVDSVQRIRNQFLDNQFRSENNATGYWTERASALSRLENLMNEPSDSGLSKTMNQFWQSLQDLSVNPDNAGARSVVLQRGHALADTFNYFSSSMNTIRSDLRTQINTTVNNTNSLIEGIGKLNEQIKNLETHGYDANDLYDKRDLLLDELSGNVNIKIEYDNSHAPNSRVDGVATVSVSNDSGDSIATLVDGEEGTVNLIDEPIYSEGNELQAIAAIYVNGSEENILASSGSLRGLAESYGYMKDEEIAGDYPEMLNQLDELAHAIVTSFNEIHSEGENGLSFFGELTDEVGGAAKAISVVLENPEDINASSNGNSGNGDRASELSDIFTNPNEYLDDASINEFFGSIIGDLGVKAEHANTMQANTMTLQHQVENQRLSVSAVSLDEEMSNLIKFQHAYSAIARGMTTMDEMLDTVINRMGLVGR